MAEESRGNDASPSAFGVIGDQEESAEFEHDSALPRATESQIAASIRASIGYLSRHLSLQGRFDYIYDPLASRRTSSYNLLRHAGTTMVLYQLAGSKFDHGGLDELAARAWFFLASRITEAKWGMAATSCIVHKNLAKLGGTALALLALAGRVDRCTSPDDRDIELLSRLARYLVSQQQVSGRFVSEINFATGQAIPFDSRYYPGEAVLALCAAFRLTGEEMFLESAIRGARYLVDGPAAVMAGEGLTDHWLMISLGQLHQLAPGFAWEEDLRKLAAPLLGLASPALGTEPAQMWWLTKGSSTEVATRLEGLVAALEVELRLGSQTNAVLLSRILLRGLAVCYRQLVGKRHRLYQDPLARGGFTRFPESSSIRIDYVQHAMAASFGTTSLLSSAKARECGAGWADV